MKRTLIILLTTFLALWLQNIYGQEVILIRHAKVNMETTGWVGAKKAASLHNSYDVSPINNFNADSVLSALPIRKTDTIYSSSLPRSITTAWMLFGDSAVILSSKFMDEFDLQIVRAPFVLPYKGWTSLSRALWLLGLNNKNNASYKDAKARTREIADFIEERLKYNKQVILVTHGFLNRDLSRELKRRNWHITNNNGKKNLGATILRK